MTYRRNIQSDESIPLPLETTFNSSIDGVIDDVYTNRVRFKYPPEWITSNVNEKIIGIRNIHLKRKRKTLNFMLYARKYKKEVFDNGFNDTVVDYMIQLLDELLDDLPDNFYYYVRDVEPKLKTVIDDASRSKYNTTFYRLNRNQRLDIMKSTLKYDDLVTFMTYLLSSTEIDDIIDELNNSDGIENRIEIRLSSMNPDDIMVYRIPISITINESDTWNDIHDKLIACVSKTNLYNYIRSVIISKHHDNVDTLDAKLTQLNSIRDDYDLMLSQCSILIDYSVPFYLTDDDDVGIFNYAYKRMKQLVIENNTDVLIYNDKYYYDYLITPINNDSYNNAYQWPDNQQKPDYGYPYLFNPYVSFNKKCYIQMDTFINNKSAGATNYLMLININTRKAYAYEMSGKGAKQVLRSLNEFIKSEPECKIITSDQDAAYLSNSVLDFMRDHDIIYTTTLDEDHNKLGIINRFMRTIRDMKDREPNTGILSLVSSYNDMPHRSLNYRSPNEITPLDELEYISSMNHQVNPYHFEPGESVRVILNSNPLTKKRTNLSKQSYIIDSKDGNQFIIRSSDGSVDTMPGYKLVKSATNVPLATTIKDGKRGIVKEIRSYNAKKDTYSVVYDDSSRDTIKSKYMRESHPTKLSTMERQYWLNQKRIPERISKFI